MKTPRHLGAQNKKQSVAPWSRSLDSLSIHPGTDAWRLWYNFLSTGWGVDFMGWDGDATID